MSDSAPPHRWRFSLKAFTVAITLLSAFLAVTLSGGPPRMMTLDRPTTIHARHYGWPMPYLRVPAGEHAGRLPADLFIPGLIIDLALAIIVVAAVVCVAGYWTTRVRAK